jgi:hypothetical protein
VIGRLFCHFDIHDYAIRWDHWEHLTWSSWECRRTDCEWTAMR